MAMTSVTLAEAATTLPEIVHRLTSGEEISLVEDGKVVARIIGEQQIPWQRPGPGLLKHMMTVAPDEVLTREPGCLKTDAFWMSPDFDEPLEDFKEYME
jgi:antitoxin (DNA-binding transcriptional repressor) of toxin-antitoxin stability system